MQKVEPEKRWQKWESSDTGLTGPHPRNRLQITQGFRLSAFRAAAAAPADCWDVQSSGPQALSPTPLPTAGSASACGPHTAATTRLTALGYF